MFLHCVHYLSDLQKKSFISEWYCAHESCQDYFKCFFSAFSLLSRFLLEHLRAAGVEYPVQ